MARRDNVELLQQVADLSEKIEDNRELTREVANLLFKLGEKPNASRVLQLTRRGSMVTLSDEMERWWAELRAKLDVRIVNPNLPPALLEKQAGVLGEIWDLAMSQARAELAAHREEADRKVAAAAERQKEAERVAEEHRRAAQTAEAARSEAERLLSGEREARRAAEADAANWRSAAENNSRDLDRAQADAATKQEEHRAALERAEQQFNDMNRQRLLEIDGLRTSNTEIRQAHKKAEQQIHDLKESERNLREMERALHEQVTARDASITQLTGDKATLAARLDAALAERDSLERARAADLEGHKEALVSRDAMVHHLQAAVESMKRTEGLLNGEVGRLQKENKELADENIRLRAAPINGKPNNKETL